MKPTRATSEHVAGPLGVEGNSAAGCVGTDDSNYRQGDTADTFTMKPSAIPQQLHLKRAPGQLSSHHGITWAMFWVPWGQKVPKHQIRPSHGSGCARDCPMINSLGPRRCAELSAQYSGRTMKMIFRLLSVTGQSKRFLQALLERLEFLQPSSS